MDTTDDVSIKHAVDIVDGVVKEKGLTLLINNAAIYEQIPLNSLTRDLMMEQYSVNTVSPLMVTRALSPQLLKAAHLKKEELPNWSRAAVLSISASVGCVSRPPMLNYGYGSSKAALNYISNVLKKQFEGSGIVVGVVHPGWVQTDMGGKKAPVTVQKSGEAILKILEKLDNSDLNGYYSYTGRVLPW